MNSTLKPVIISPPFGTYIDANWATSVKGTWTAHKRSGSKIVRALQTIRPAPGGWVNRMGLINKGVKAGDYSDPNCIYSVAAVDDKHEWEIIHNSVPHNRMIELNISCPNANHSHPSYRTLRTFRELYDTIIIKLSPHHTNIYVVEQAIELGITHFHCCNTYPTPDGGQSGAVVKRHSLQLIEDIKKEFANAVIIGGGGIYSPEDVRDYRNVGATHFSLATIWFTPWRVPTVLREIYHDQVSNNMDI